MSKVVSIVEKQTDNARYSIEQVLKVINNYDEVVVLARKKGENGYTRFHGKLNDTFWWVGVLEGVKRLLLDESLTHHCEE